MYCYSSKAAPSLLIQLGMLINNYFRKNYRIKSQLSHILVTGGTGFLGAYVISELMARGYKVRALKRPSGSWPAFMDSHLSDEVDWVEGDVLDQPSLENALQGIDGVVHAAGVVSFSKHDRERMYKVNVEGTANIVNASLETGVRRFLQISSVAALGRRAVAGRLDETSKWQQDPGQTHYAISKYRGELEVWRGFAEGLNGAILNPATILGYGDWHTGSCAIFRNVYDEFGWFSRGINGFAGVEDTARAVAALLESDVTEERFIVCNDNWSFKTLLETMADGFGRRRPSREATPLIAALAWRYEKLRSLFTGQAPLITRESAQVANANALFDSSKFLKTFPEFHYHSLEQIIKEACSRYLDDVRMSKS